MRLFPIVAFASVLAAAAVLATVSPGFAQQAGAGSGASSPQELPVKAVLELYTSQGCSSCPAADALLEKYAKRRDVLALSLPVDYWDYLGWKDTLANTKFSARQREYAKHRGDGRIYTPQMVINGNAHVIGSNEAEIDAAIAKHQAAFVGSGVSLRMRSEKGRIIIDVGAARDDGAAAKDATIWLAMIQKTAPVEITRGENRGKTITYFNVVRELTPIGMWSGKAETVQLNRDVIQNAHTESCAILLQSGKAGPIIAAAFLGKL